MSPVESIKIFLPISFFGTWGAVLYLLYKWRGDKSMSISRHAAKHKKAYLLMLIVETITFSLFFLFVYKWFVPTFKLPSFFNVLIAVSCGGFIVAALIPDVSGRKGIIHSLSAYTASMVFIPALALMFVSYEISNYAKVVIIFALIFQLGSVSAFMVIKNAKNYHLYIQSMYFLVFDLSLLAATYIR